VEFVRLCKNAYNCKKEDSKMAKGKRKKGTKKRNLKYGQVSSVKAEGSRSDDSISSKKSAGEAPKSKENTEFKKEIRRNLIFIGSFFAVLLVLYFLLTKTSVLDPVLNLFGLSGLYK